MKRLLNFKKNLKNKKNYYIIYISKEKDRNKNNKSYFIKKNKYYLKIIKIFDIIFI